MVAVDWMGLAQGVISVLVAFTIAVGAARRFSVVRDWIKDALGVTAAAEKIDATDEKIDAIGVLVIDEGEAINQLNDTVCNELKIPNGERPPRIKTGLARGLFTSDEREHHPGDFLRGGSGDEGPAD